jgi:hypothetical protein
MYTLEDGSRVDEIPHTYTGKATDNYNVSYWYKDGKLHHTDGPAAIYCTEEQAWYYHGVRHRVGGPAYENTAKGFSAYKEWWILNNYISHLDRIIIICLH